jgi:hypothetical protein
MRIWRTGFGQAAGRQCWQCAREQQDFSFVIYAGYDASNLYVAVRVTDDAIQEDDAAADSANGNTWMDDSVELFLDGDNSNFATRDTSGTNRRWSAPAGSS